MSAHQIVDKKDRRKLAEFLAGEGEVLVPLLEMLQTAEASVNEAVAVIGRAGIEALLMLSAQQVAGPKQPGKKRAGSSVHWYGHQEGVVQLEERKLRVERPRLRKKSSSKEREVPVPVYEMLQANARVTQRVLRILLAGVSTRNYRDVLPQMAKSVGISKSSVSREMIEGREGVAIGDPEAQRLGYVVGTRSSLRCGQSSGRVGRDVHDQSDEPLADVASMPGHHEHYRVVVFRNVGQDRLGETLAGWGDGHSLGGHRVAGNGKALQEDHGVS